MTFNDLQADVFRRCGYAASPAADVVTRVKAFINETQQTIMSEPGMNWLMNDQLLLAAVSAQAEYALPQTVLRVKKIRHTASGRTLPLMSLDQYREQALTVVSSADIAESYAELGNAYVYIQLAGAGEQCKVLGVAGDVHTVYLEGFRTGGFPFASSVALTGTTPVNIGPSDATSITKFYSSSVDTTKGSTILRNAATTAISTIPTSLAGLSVPRIRMVALIPTPSAVAASYTVDFERTVTDMTIANDEPVLPVQYHRLLAVGARMKEYEKQNQMPRYEIAEKEYTTGLNNMKYWIGSTALGESAAVEALRGLLDPMKSQATLFRP